MTRRACVFTSGRQDYGILRSTIHALAAAPDFELVLLAGGMHLRERFGKTIEVIRSDGVIVSRELDFIAEPPAPAGDTGRAIESVFGALMDLKPEFLILVGDRHETLAAGIAAALAAVPVVHLHGGEETLGAVDNSFRHALTKLSHLHLVSSPLHAQRVIQMGEASTSVIVVGAPGLDNMFRNDLENREQLAQHLGNALTPPLVLVTLHPTTLGESVLEDFVAVTDAMMHVQATYVVTQPNADEGGARLRDLWSAWSQARGNVVLVDALGERLYWSLLTQSDAVLGNSSSGIIEAPAAGIPSVDVGMRQQGREAPGTVLHVAADSELVEQALRSALGVGRHAALAEKEPAANLVLRALRNWSPPNPPLKHFHLQAQQVCAH